MARFHGTPAPGPLDRPGCAVRRSGPEAFRRAPRVHILAKSKYMEYPRRIVLPAKAVGSIRQFNRFYTALIGVLDRRILRSPYSLTEVRILYEVAHDDGANARRLVNALGIDEGYLSRTIDSLERRGLLSRRRSTADGRLFHLSLTARGRAVMRELEKAAAAEIQAIISPLSHAEVAEVVAGMQRIQDLLGRGDMA